MNKEKFNNIVMDEIHTYSVGGELLGGVTPENWNEHKKVIAKFVESVDEAVEIYNMENKESK